MKPTIETGPVVNKPSHPICPVERAGALDTWYRRRLQNPRKILKPYLKPGMRALDLGCGPGYFSFPMAELVGPEGKVVAADIQRGMLDLVQTGASSASRAPIETHLCSETGLNLKGEFNFILAFYMLHETPDLDRALKEIMALTAPGGDVLVAEPAFLGLTFRHFKSTQAQFERSGFDVQPLRGLWLAKAFLAHRTE